MPENSPKCTVGLVQMAASEDRRTNLENAVNRIREAARASATIVCLQELFLVTLLLSGRKS